MHYNTTKEKGQKLKGLNKRAGNQDHYVLMMLEKAGRFGFTTDELISQTTVKLNAQFEKELAIRYSEGFGAAIEIVNRHIKRIQMLPTSMRRSFSRLYKKGLIEKTDKQREGSRGIKNYVYKIKAT